jgi:autotransporter-associated beta strand protein
MTLRLLLAAACAALVGSPASAASSHTILVTSETITMATHDLTPHGPSKGDTVTYRDRLVNAVAQFGRKQGSPIGSDSGKLTFTGAHSATFSGRTTLPGGTLTLAGPVFTLQNGDLVIPVVGGTGSFAGLRGTLTVSTGKDHVLNTYRLNPVAPAPVA